MNRRKEVVDNEVSHVLAEASRGKCQQRTHHRTRASPASSSFLHSKRITLLGSSGSNSRTAFAACSNGAAAPYYHPKHFRFAGEMLRRFLCQIILAGPVEQRLATANLYRALIFCDHLPDPMLRCAVLSRCAGTAFRTICNPCLCSPLGIGAGPILIAGCGANSAPAFQKKPADPGMTS